MQNALSALGTLPHAATRQARTTAVQQIYADLRLLIIDMTLPPGTVISKKEIASQIGVSETPVREALILLEEEDLVDIFPQSRTQVSLIDVQSAKEAHFLRLSVEIEVARELARTISKEGLAFLKTSIQEHEAISTSGDQSAFKLADNNFHQSLFKLAGVEGLTQIIDRRRGHYDRIRGLYLQEQERRKIVLKEHRAIYSALKNGDEAAAEAAIRKHLGKSLAIVDQIRELHPDYFAHETLS